MNQTVHLSQMLPTKFRFIWPRGFREEDFFKSANQKQELPMSAMFVNESELNEQYLQRTFQGCFLPCLGSLGKAASDEKIFQKSTNQKQELPVAAMFCSVLSCRFLHCNRSTPIFIGYQLQVVVVAAVLKSAIS